MNRIIFTVTNDLNYDQRMQRICTSLAAAGFDCLLVGRKLKTTASLSSQNFLQKRISCFFNKGFLFYAEYNFRLFWFLLFQKMDAVCAIDLDTILPNYFVSVLRNKKRIYDAHELFTEMKEVITRKNIHAFWLRIEKFAVPKFQYCYTVSGNIGNELKCRYGVHFSVIRNVPIRLKVKNQKSKEYPIFFIYQGAVNEARGLENLIPAIKYVDALLYIYGDGNLFDEIKALIEKNNLQDKVFLKGKLNPDDLFEKTINAYAGINLVEPLGLNQIYSLANKFFDYMQAGIPQMTMNFPEYKKINDQFEVAVLVDNVEEKKIANGLNVLLNDKELYERLKANCFKAAEKYNWQNEEKILIEFYQNIFKESN